VKGPACPAPSTLCSTALTPLAVHKLMAEEDWESLRGMMGGERRRAAPGCAACAVFKLAAAWPLEQGVPGLPPVRAVPALLWRLLLELPLMRGKGGLPTVGPSACCSQAVQGDEGHC
jgi:hypothetical protein